MNLTPLAAYFDFCPEPPEPGASATGVLLPDPFGSSVAAVSVVFTGAEEVVSAGLVSCEMEAGGTGEGVVRSG